MDFQTWFDSSPREFIWIVLFAGFFLHWIMYSFHDVVDYWRKD